MNELRNICEAYARGRERGERMALATVVSVEGSAYRRPGARMLVVEGGETAGSISGGCLERDVAERAAPLMKTCGTRIVEYDTRGDADIVWGLGLGCNGVVRVLLESLHEGSSAVRAMEFAGECLRARRRGVVATLVAGARPEVGRRLFLGGELGGTCDEDAFAEGLPAERVRADAFEALARGRTASQVYEAGAAGPSEIFFDVFTPPRPLFIFGAEQDALPLVRQAQAVGWHVTVVDTRARPASRVRFAEAEEVLLCRAGEVSARVTLTEEAAAVVMTHNFLDDVELLGALLPSPACYLGVLGPRARTSKLLETLRADGRGMDGAAARLHGPVGLDIGAEGPEEVALSIVAEIKAVCAARGGGFLRERDAPIHEESAVWPSVPAVVEAARAVCHTS